MKKQLKYLACYGSLKLGFHNEQVLRGAEYLGTCLTEPKYTMFSMGGYPAVSPVGDTPIHLEIYQTDDDKVINRVYNLEGYTGKRNHPDNWYDTVEVDTPYGKAEMFIFKTPPINKKVVESGKW